MTDIYQQLPLSDIFIRRVVDRVKPNREVFEAIFGPILINQVIETLESRNAATPRRMSRSVGAGLVWSVRDGCIMYQRTDLGVYISIGGPSQVPIEDVDSKIASFLASLGVEGFWGADVTTKNELARTHIEKVEVDGRDIRCIAKQDDGGQ